MSHWFCTESGDIHRMRTTEFPVWWKMIWLGGLGAPVSPSPVAPGPQLYSINELPANDSLKQFEMVHARARTFVCSQRRLTVSSRHDLPENDGPLYDVDSAKVGEEKARLGEEVMGWYRKGKLQHDASIFQAILAAYPVPTFLKNDRACEYSDKGRKPLKPVQKACVEMFSEARLSLTPKWFSGQEWADGTAELYFQNEYLVANAREQAIEDAKTPAQKAKERRQAQKRKFSNWFQYSLHREDSDL